MWWAPVTRMEIVGIFGAWVWVRLGTPWVPKLLWFCIEIRGLGLI
jgi:hypothetical protein